MPPRIRSASRLSPSGKMRPWIDALRAIDRRGDKTALVELLTSGRPIPAEARRLLADLILRSVKRPRGGRRTPAYELSEAHRFLLWAKESVHDQVRRGKSQAEAIELAARVYGVSEQTLVNYLAKRHRAARRDASHLFKFK